LLALAFCVGCRILQACTIIVDCRWWSAFSDLDLVDLASVRLPYHHPLSFAVFSVFVRHHDCFAMARRFDA
jgi:hypothetical protein